mgnify:CR=1 FL=1
MAFSTTTSGMALVLLVAFGLNAGSAGAQQGEPSAATDVSKLKEQIRQLKRQVQNAQQQLKPSREEIRLRAIRRTPADEKFRHGHLRRLRRPSNKLRRSAPWTSLRDGKSAKYCSIANAPGTSSCVSRSPNDLGCSLEP